MLIAGDSLLVMNSLLEKEGMAGKIQMIYIDPPYGIKYGSNFQPFINKRDVKDGKDEDLTQEPETIKAFRDTWELGIHSYLTYLRNRLLLSRDLLSETGSIFVQISDENVHHVREILDEIFGASNFLALIPFRKKLMPLGGKTLENMDDYLLWYAKSSKEVKYHQLYYKTDPDIEGIWRFVELPNGERRKLSREERTGEKKIVDNSRIYTTVSILAPSFSESSVFEIELEGRKFYPPKGQCWITSKNKMDIW